MSRLNRIPTWSIVALVGVIMMALALFVPTAHPGVYGLDAVRNYLFWGLAIAPVAYLGDMLVRSTIEYSAVQRVVARVRNDR